MKIKKIRIQNFRQFIDSTILLEDNTTILAGANNSGKTSLVELFKKIFTNKNKTFNEYDIPVTVVKKWVDDLYIPVIKVLEESEEETKLKDIYGLFKTKRETESQERNKKFKMKTLKVDIEIEYRENEKITKFSDYLMDLDEEKTSFYFRFMFELNEYKFLKVLEKNFKILQNRYDSIKREESSILKFKKIIKKIYFDSLEEKYYFCDSSFKLKEELTLNEFTKLFNIQFISANRNLDDQDSDNNRNLSSGLINIINKDEEWINTFEDLPEKILKPITDTNLKEEIQEKSIDKLDYIFETISKTNGNKSEKILLDMDIEHSHIKVLLEKVINAKYLIDEYYLPEYTQGLGYSHLIYLHFELENFKNNFDESIINLCIIEEPEAHMHPQMQKIFMKYLIEYFEVDEFQCLVTTHSSQIIKVIKIPRIRVIRKKEQFRNDIFDMKRFIDEISDADEDLRKFYNLLFNINFSEIIFADKLVFYEGDTERMYLQKIISDIEDYSDLAQEYIAYVQVGGAYAHKYKNIINFLEIKSLIITDIDYEKVLTQPNDIKESVTTNSAITEFYQDDNPDKTDIKISDIYSWYNNVIGNQDSLSLVVFQTDKDHHTRTLEEAMLAECFNVSSDESKKRDEWCELKEKYSFKYSIPRKEEAIFLRDIVNSTSNNKTDFMYSVLLSEYMIKTVPNYLKEGLEWLKN